MNISAIIVTYNPSLIKVEKLVKTLLSSKVSVVIVDNNSSNDFFLNESFGEVNTCLLRENKGIAKAQNCGIEIAIKNKSDYVLFFDQDSIIDEFFVDNLLRDFNFISEKEVSVAAIGPRFIDEKKNFYFPGLRFNKYGLIDKFDVSKIIEPFEVSFLISSGTLVSLDALKKIDLMKEEFFIDYVDTEWCFRALSMNYKLFMSNNAVMKHSIGDDTIQFFKYNIPVHSGFRRYYRVRNLFFMWKIPYIPKILTTKLMLTNFFHQILLILLRKNKYDYLKYYFKAIYDGIKQSKNYHG